MLPDKSSYLYLIRTLKILIILKHQNISDLKIKNKNKQYTKQYKNSISCKINYQRSKYIR